MSLEARVAQLEAAKAHTDGRLAHMDEVLTEITKDLKAVRSFTDRWSGGKTVLVTILGFTVPALLGGAVAWWVK